MFSVVSNSCWLFFKTFLGGWRSETFFTLPSGPGRSSDWKTIELDETLPAAKAEFFFETEVVLTGMVWVKRWSSPFLASGWSRLHSIRARLGVTKLVLILGIWVVVLQFCCRPRQDPPNRRESSGRLSTCLALPFLGLLVCFVGGLQLLFRGQGVIKG